MVDSRPEIGHTETDYDEPGVGQVHRVPSRRHEEDIIVCETLCLDPENPVRERVAEPDELFVVTYIHPWVDGVTIDGALFEDGEDVYVDFTGDGIDLHPYPHDARDTPMCVRAGEPEIGPDRSSLHAGGVYHHPVRPGEVNPLVEEITAAVDDSYEV